MKVRAAQKSFASLLVLGLAAPAFLNCGAGGPEGAGAGGPSGLGGISDVPGAACKLDLSSPEAVANANFKDEFGLSADVTAKLKAGTEAALDIRAFSDKLDADLKAACGKLSADLGGPSDYKSGQEACEGVAKVVADMKAKLGAGASYTLDIKPPVCGASVDAYADCAGKCDATVTPGSAKVECEGGKATGECDAQCSGTCEMSAAAKCTGKCTGSCDASFSGACGGNCDGKCDGKNTKGACSGKCEGKCDANASGSCGGSCSGSCELAASAKCSGTCSGTCSVHFKAPKCTSAVEPPKMSGECKAHCDAQVHAKAECTPAKVVLLLKGATDAALAAKFKAAAEGDLPLVLKIAMGMGDQAVKVAGNVKATVEGVQATVQGIASGGGGGGAALSGAKVSACLLNPLKGALDAAGSVKGKVDASVSVKASFSASASGSASGKTAAGNTAPAAPKG